MRSYGYGVRVRTDSAGSSRMEGTIWTPYCLIGLLPRTGGNILVKEG
jgi:hypothetical protein